MKRILLSLLFFNAAQSADVVTVDPTGVTTVVGTAPATAPGAGEVKIGGGQISTAGNVNVNGTVYAKDIKVGTGVHAENHKLILWGPNTPAGEGSHQALSFEFASAGSAQVRAYRGGSWDTYLQFLTNSVVNGSSTTPTVRMHISENGNVGIGTTAPASKLTVAGDVSASSVIINGKAPGQAGGIAMLDDKGKLVAEQLPLEALNQRPIPSFSVDGAGSTVAVGGRFYFSTLSISAAQTVSVPTKIFANGDVTIGGAITASMPIEIESQGNVVINAAITSSSPIEIKTQGNVSINAGISAPFFSIRTAGSVTVNGPINVHGASGINPWTFTRLGLKSRPWFNDGYYTTDPNTGQSTYVPYVVDPYVDLFRAIIIEAQNGFISTNLGTLRGDDIFIFSGANMAIGSEIRSWWHYPGGVACIWTDGLRVYSGYFGGTGGTAGGWGRGQVTEGTSIWRGSSHPYLLPTYELARGSMGGNARADQRGAAGGRISLYAAGNIDATGASINANSQNNNSSGQMVGGAGTVRAVAGGTISGGTWTANGGTGNGSQEHGGGGGVFTIASGYAGTVTVTATAVYQAVAGTALQITLPASTIYGLRGQGLFNVFPPDPRQNN